MDDIKILYTERIDEKKSKYAAKKYLLFLTNYVDDNEIVNYINFTSSIIGKPGANKNRIPIDVKYLDAIEEKDMKKAQMAWILDGIIMLPRMEQNIVLDTYVYKLSTERINEKYKISDPTRRRKLSDSYLHLASILDIEVLVDGNL